MKFYIEDFSKIGRDNSSFVKSHKSERCITWRPRHIYGNISL